MRVEGTIFYDSLKMSTYSKDFKKYCTLNEKAVQTQ